jgi:TIR domain
MTYDAFISYRRDGGASQARLIRSELTNRGYRVFLDVADLDKGHFDDKLLTTIAETPNFIVVLAPGSLDKCVNEGDWLRRELQQAIATKRNVVPVCLPGFSFPSSLPADIADLSRHQAVEYSHTLFDATIEKISKAIGQPSGVSGRARRRGAIAAGIALAGVAVTAVLYLTRPAPEPSRDNPERTGPPHAAKFTATVIPMVESDGAVITKPGQGGDAPGGADKPPVRGEPDPALYTVAYRYRRIADGFAVNYQLPYLDLLRAGGPIAGIRYETSPFVATFPRLRATIANNAPQQVLVTSVVLDIAKSDLRNDVVLTVDDGSTNTIVLVNHGWGDVEDAKLVFTIGDPGRTPPFVSAPRELSLGTFSASKIVPIVKYVPDELANSDIAEIVGTLEHGPSGHRQAVKLTTTVRLQTRYGKALPPSEVYDLFFIAGQAGRIVADLPTAHQIKPGEAEAIDLRISTDRSSETTMKMSFLTAEGEEIPANALTLDLFVPRFLGMQLRQRANRSKH